MDLRRRPKRSASEATPRMLVRCRRCPVVKGSAVEGRDNGALRGGLLAKENISSKARELAEADPGLMSTKGETDCSRMHEGTH
jgi:hypothetical protein